LGRSWVSFAFAGLLGVTACGAATVSDLGTSTNLVTNGHFSATVNGTAWSALGRVPVTRPTANSVGMLAGSTTYGMTFTILNITGPGTFSLNNAPSNGNQVIASNINQSGWATGQTGGTGSVVITAFSATHIAGTFSFDATPIPGTPATGTLHVTNGSFDLTF
jgi:hypothetical protein